MISLFQAIFLGAVQGITELFPISSLGHSVIMPGLLRWHIDQNASAFLEFLVATHFATAFVLFLIYRKDWLRIIQGMFRSLKERTVGDSDLDAKLGWLLVISTVPAGIIGLTFEDRIKNFFLSPTSAAFFLFLNGILLWIAEILRKKASKGAQINDADQRVAKEMTWWQSCKIGLCQIVALIPGFSRTGSTITGGLMTGLSHEDALRYSFLLSTPIIGAAAILELPNLFASQNTNTIIVVIVGCISAGIAAYFSARFLAHYFKTKSLLPFSIYCIIAGTISMILLR